MKIKLSCFFFLVIAFFSNHSYAQPDPSWNIGVGIGGIIGVNEAVHQSLNPQLHIYGLWLNGIAPHCSFEFGIGLTTIASSQQGGFSEYSTNLIPIDLRIRYAPLSSTEWQPYVYAGIGLLPYLVTSSPPNKSSDSKPSGTSVYLPLGIGIYHPFDKKWAVEASIGENPSFTDDLNPVHDDRNDAFWGFKIGVTYSFAEENSQPQINSDEFDFGTRGTKQIFGSIAFDSAKARLRPESDPLLVPVLNALVNHPEIEIQIRAYTDDLGDFNTAMALTQDRAESIKVWLVSRGVSASRISTQGYGPHDPLVPNDSPENRLRNHRIEIVRMK